MCDTGAPHEVDEAKRTVPDHCRLYTGLETFSRADMLQVTGVRAARMGQAARMTRGAPETGEPSF